MPWISAGATVLGGLMGGKGSKGQQQTMQTPNSNVSFSQLTPNSAAMPGYGWLGGLMQNYMQNPQPYFPGQTYVSPSQMTQQGVGSLQNAGGMLDYANQAIGMGLPYVQQGSEMMAQNAGQAQMAQGLYNQGLPYFGQAANAYSQGSPYYEQAAGYMGQANPYFQQAAGLTGGGINNYLGAQGQMQQASGLASQGANWLAGKANSGYFEPFIQGAQNNYNFLSGAADVANNPYVQGMIQQNTAAANDQLGSALNQLQGHAVGVGNLGSSRLGLAQGQAAGDVNKALQQTNANMQLNAYQQGLGAQQNALSQTGSLFNNMMMPGTALGQASGMMQNSGGLLGQAGGMAGAAGNAAAQQGNYFNQMGQNALNQGGAYGQMAQGLLGAGGAFGQAGGQAMQGFGAGNQAAQSMTNAGLGYGQTMAGLLGQGAGNYAQQAGYYGQGGQTVEGYQQQALQDQMNRFNWMYQEPMQRMQMVQSILGSLQPVGIQQGGGTTMQTQQNPNYMSPMQGVIGGASLGGSLGRAAGQFFGY